jgi:hypothetical protein
VAAATLSAALEGRGVRSEVSAADRSGVVCLRRLISHFQLTDQLLTNNNRY